MKLTLQYWPEPVLAEKTRKRTRNISGFLMLPLGRILEKESSESKKQWRNKI
jgi:hypothetical protein